jgi:hypothetical protein
LFWRLSLCLLKDFKQALRRIEEYYAAIQAAK